MRSNRRRDPVIDTTLFIEKHGRHPNVGEECRVSFGIVAQRCKVERYNRNGKAVIRAFNASRNEWYPNTRTVDPVSLYA